MNSSLTIRLSITQFHQIITHSKSSISDFIDISRNTPTPGGSVSALSAALGILIHNDC